MCDNIRKSILILGVLLILVTPAHAGGNRTTFASPSFASCGVRVECSPGTCSDDVFEIGSGCSASCSATGGPAVCNAQINANTSPEIWALDSFLTLYLEGDTFNVQASFDATGERLSPDLLQLSGRIDIYISNSSASLLGGVLELAVFRYSGAPGDLEGVQVESVNQLVAMGLIDADDILFIETFPYAMSELHLPFSYGVDVSGIPSDEIVVFASESGVTLVPAISGLGLLVLTILMLAAATYTLGKRRQA
ncbi:hypothetical protein DRQ32_09365 [bacterium]|nr:MAG: hypothetical protein DRQ32_09365 [bacterium]